jgi:glycosyltransferase involved in cell wall biosynthesis
VLALTGTDVYRDIHKSPHARASLTLADRIVVLQPRALRELTPTQRKKAVVIYQSVKLPPALKNPRVSDHFDICVAGHLRPVKDPFRAAWAARMLPESSRIRIIQAGGALSKNMERRTRAEMRKNPRYVWQGALSSERTLSLLARSKVCVISSLMEGGANVLSEAIVIGTPVLASRIAGNVGIAETDREFLGNLRHHVRELASLFEPECERIAWSNLLAGLTGL